LFDASYIHFSSINYLCIQFKIKMVDGVAELVINIVSLAAQGILFFFQVKEGLSDRRQNNRSLSNIPPISQHPRAVLIASSC
jgi:hypothetical protein